jgi:hypothetical protein
MSVKVGARMTGRIAGPGKKTRKRAKTALNLFNGDSRHLHVSGEQWHCHARPLPTGQGIGVLALKILFFSTCRRFALVCESYDAMFIFIVVPGRSASVEGLAQCAAWSVGS